MSTYRVWVRLEEEYDDIEADSEEEAFEIASDYAMSGGSWQKLVELNTESEVKDMSDFKVGDKVYLECEVREKDMSDDTYRLEYKDCSDGYSITDFVKDDVLHTPDEAYNRGLNDAWELAKKIVLPDHLGGYTVDELKDIFGKNSFASLMNTFTPQEALAKVKAYEEEQDEIKIGDVIKLRNWCTESIVTRVDGDIIYRLFKDGSCDSISTKVRKDLEKTGRHFDSIDEFTRSADD